MKTLRIAHLSDLHFSHITFNPSQFLSKRWIGNLNLIFFRQFVYRTGHLHHVPQLLNTLLVEQVCITGDFSSLSLDSEFAEGRDFLKSISQPLTYLPGNHDCYIESVEKSRRFYDFFPSEDLKTKRVEKKAFGKGWWWVGLDCTYPTPPFYALGIFNQEIERELERVLAEIPQGARVILGNHFPLYPTNRPMHDLQGAEQLQALLKRHPEVKLYLHGHDHGHYVKDKRDEGLPLVFNCGSAAHITGSFYLFELHEEECLVQHMLFQKKKGEFSWVIDWEKRFTYLK